MTAAPPLTVIPSEEPGGPTTILDDNSATELTLINRVGVRLLTARWETPGIYVLVDQRAADGTFGVYVGKSQEMRSRLGSHDRNKDHWYRAVLMRRDTTLGFNTTHIGWLEGRAHQLLDARADTAMHNGQQPGDATLASHEERKLEECVRTLMRVLTLIGHGPDGGVSPVVSSGAEVAAVAQEERALVEEGLFSAADDGLFADDKRGDLDTEDEPVVEESTPRHRREPTVPYLVRHMLIPVGERLHIHGRFPNRTLAPQMKEWLAEHDDGEGISWRPDLDPARPLRWANVQWTASGLAKHVLREVSGVRRSLDGSWAWWVERPEGSGTGRTLWGLYEDHANPKSASDSEASA